MMSPILSPVPSLSRQAPSLRQNQQLIQTQHRNYAQNDPNPTLPQIRCTGCRLSHHDGARCQSQCLNLFEPPCPLFESDTGIPISSNSFRRPISDDQVGRFLDPWSPEPGDNHWTPSHHPFIARRRNKSAHYRGLT